MLKIYNTLTRKKEEFQPQDSQTVRMYTCGVTVYDDCHIGHGRSLYIFEVIRRYLKYNGFKVRLVRNITDVDDKIIDKARQRSKEKNIPLKDAFNQVRKAYIDSYRKDLKLLNIPEADKEPLATENISEMIEYIKGLINKEFAYEVEGNVYFRVRKSKDYGKLSGKKIDDLLESVRIDSDPFKKDPLDFALWKKAKDDEPFWDSPWRKGRPGWHIECSVMSQKYLKTDTLDIHGGGRDLVFPHHENEIAQSEALTGKTFAKCWIHHGLLTINKQKMAKSLGNFITIKDVLDKYPADVLKLFYLQAHYSSSADFSWERMEEAKKAYERIYILMNRLNTIDDKEEPNKHSQVFEEFRDKFIQAMDDDFNMPKGLAVVFDIINECNKLLEKGFRLYMVDFVVARCVIREILDIFGIGFIDKAGLSEKKIDEKMKLREKYRSEKNYEEADKIRKELDEEGIILEDGKEGSWWRPKISTKFIKQRQA